MSYDYRAINRVFHSPIRFAVMAMLANEQQSNFVAIRKAVGATEGNLATHMRKLEDSGYVAVRKSFKGRKPRTEYEITEAGRSAFQTYLDQLNRIVSSGAKTEPNEE